MKRSLVALLVMIGLVGGLVAAGCGERPSETTTTVKPPAGAQEKMEEGARAMEEAVESATAAVPK